MLGVYEFKTILDIVMLALAQNKIKPSLLSFHFLLFFSLSPSQFFKQVTIYNGNSEKKTEPCLCLLL